MYWHVCVQVNMSEADADFFVALYFLRLGIFLGLNIISLPEGSPISASRVLRLQDDTTSAQLLCGFSKSILFLVLVGQVTNPTFFSFLFFLFSFFLFSLLSFFL